MSNQYDEIKRLLKNSREMLSSEQVNESRKTLIKKGLIKEMDIKPDNLAADTEEEIEMETEPQ